MAANSSSSSYGSAPDVQFVFPQNEGATINVEKRKLKSISEVFRTQFSSGFDNTQPIKITDISFDVFNMLMNFIYNEEISITKSNYQEILYAATKYFINPIISEVIKCVPTFITSENVAHVFEFFDNYEIQKINDHILDICVKNPVEVIAKLSGSNVHMKLLKEILQSTLMDCSEYDLYVAVQKMIENVIPEHVTDVAAEMRKKLGNLINLIRFPTMSVNELARCVKPPSLLTGDQHSDLLLFAEMGFYKESVKSFSTKPRLNLQKYINEFTKCKKCAWNKYNEYLCLDCKTHYKFFK